MYYYHAMEVRKAAPPIEQRGFTLQIKLRPFTVVFERHRIIPQDSSTQNEPSIRDLQERQRQFRRERPKFDAKDTGEHLVDRLVEESAEMRAELPPPTRQATQMEKDKIAGELSDCLSFIFNIANHYGIDAAIAFYTKMAEVEERYPPHLFQLNDGRTFDEAYHEARRLNGHE